jgi:sterol desaturase/sphingolipid hydroxylase (fatty acid hydroxylase superfamily)
VLNLLLAAFFLPSPAEIRPPLESLLGIDLPAWPISNTALAMLAGFLLLDLLHYLTHRLDHAVPLLWRFHALHHSDPDVDVTTAVRHHPVEYVINSAVYWLAILVLGVPAAVALSHGLAVFSTAAVQHGNIRLPGRIERWLQPVLVTADMHRIHHSVSSREANSNYGTVFSIWDRLLGSYTQLSPVQHDHIVFGVRELPARECLRPSSMLMTPWRLARAATARG